MTLAPHLAVLETCLWKVDLNRKHLGKYISTKKSVQLEQASIQYLTYPAQPDAKAGVLLRCKHGKIPLLVLHRNRLMKPRFNMKE